jgi:predicted Zn-dependent peptidase
VPVEILRLDNGVTIICEPLPHVHSASIGIWVRTGSRQEQPLKTGISHFLEHMFFKGTSSYDAALLARKMDALGGQFNAQTHQEYTSFYAKVISENLEPAFLLLSELLTDSVFPDQELPNEIKVVLEEIKMYEDHPDEAILDLFPRELWPDHPLGTPILGTIESVSNFTRDDLVNEVENRYRKAGTLITVSGKVDVKSFLKLAKNTFDKQEFGKGLEPDTPPQSEFIIKSFQHELEQVHFCFGLDSISRSDPRRYNISILNCAIGGGMSSRLFQEVREKRGLAYSISTFTSSFKDSGMFAITGGTTPDQLYEVLKICHRELTDILNNGLSEEEIEISRQQLITSLLMGQENTLARMGRLADLEIYFGEFFPIEYSVDKIKAITTETIKKTAADLLDPDNMTLVSIGPVKLPENWTEIGKL